MVEVRDNKRQVPGSASLGGPVSDQDKLLRPQGIFTVLAYGNYIILNDSSAAQASATFSPGGGRTSDQWRFLCGAGAKVSMDCNDKPTTRQLHSRKPDVPPLGKATLMIWPCGFWLG